MGKILTDHGVKQKLVQRFHTTQRTVRWALAYKTNTIFAQKIRYAAIKEYGGIEKPDSTL